MIYLATPYSHPNSFVRERRFRAVNRIAAELIANGDMVFSPISHTHPIATSYPDGGLPMTFNYWEGFDRKMIEICDQFIVYCQPGWDSSVGVKAEMAIADELGIKIEYLDP